MTCQMNNQLRIQMNMYQNENEIRLEEYHSAGGEFLLGCVRPRAAAEGTLGVLDDDAD